MPDSLSKLIRLSNRHGLPVIVHDSQSGDSAVLMSLDEFEKMSECCEDYPIEADNENVKFPDFGEAFEENDEESEDEYDDDAVDEAFFANLAEKSKKTDTHFDSWGPSPFANLEPSLPSEEPPVWPDETDFSALNDEAVKAAHDFHAERSNLDWEGDRPDEFRYEPTRESALFPAFSPDDEEDSDEEPIFFEEPV